MQIKIVNKSKHVLPEYATILSAGMDLRADIDSDIILAPMERKLIPTNLFIELPEGVEGQVRPRSGLALKEGITVLNAPGTVDADFRGSIGVILINLSLNPYVIVDGHRIAQFVIAKHEKAEWLEVEVLSETVRGEGGYNSTGIK
jgi:dUTP pyrophosphatase